MSAVNVVPQPAANVNNSYYEDRMKSKHSQKKNGTPAATGSALFQSTNMYNLGANMHPP